MILSFAQCRLRTFESPSNRGVNRVHDKQATRLVFFIKWKESVCRCIKLQRHCRGEQSRRFHAHAACGRNLSFAFLMHSHLASGSRNKRKKKVMQHQNQLQIAICVDGDAGIIAMTNKKRSKKFIKIIYAGNSQHAWRWLNWSRSDGLKQKQSWRLLTLWKANSSIPQIGCWSDAPGVSWMKIQQFSFSVKIRLKNMEIKTTVEWLLCTFDIRWVFTHQLRVLKLHWRIHPHPSAVKLTSADPFTCLTRYHHVVLNFKRISIQLVCCEGWRKMAA